MAAWPICLCRPAPSDSLGMVVDQRHRSSATLTGRTIMLLQDRVALITAGAGAGIGHAVAERFLEEGAQVVITDAHAKRTEETAAALGKQFNREVLGIGVDVTVRSQIEDAVAKTIEKFGRIDILFNNAGINKLERFWSSPTRPGIS